MGAGAIRARRKSAAPEGRRSGRTCRDARPRRGERAALIAPSRSPAGAATIAGRNQVQEVRPKQRITVLTLIRDCGRRQSMGEGTNQLGLDLMLPRRRGGRRAGAGRKPGPKSRIPHRGRGAVSRHTPCHVTLRVRPDVPCLRDGRLAREIERSFGAACEHGRFRLVHYSLQRDHVHLLVEADAPAAPARGAECPRLRAARLPEARDRGGSRRLVRNGVAGSRVVRSLVHRVDPRVRAPSGARAGGAAAIVAAAARLAAPRRHPPARDARCARLIRGDHPLPGTPLSKARARAMPARAQLRPPSEERAPTGDPRSDAPPAPCR